MAEGHWGARPQHRSDSEASEAPAQSGKKSSSSGFFGTPGLRAALWKPRRGFANKSWAKPSPGGSLAACKHPHPFKGDAVGKGKPRIWLLVCRTGGGSALSWDRVGTAVSKNRKHVYTRTQGPVGNERLLSCYGPDFS